MNQEIFDWLLLLGRWLHITVGITWIGTSIFFMWLDRSFEFNENSKSPGHIGDLWMVHGGGFYHVEKLLIGPTKVPEHLHWFKWESYWTWMSGVFLIVMIFYTGNGSFLLDSSISNIGYWQAIGLSVFSIAGSWFFYDILWEQNFVKSKAYLGHILTLLWLSGMSYFLCHLLSGRAAYMHMGSMLGTWMTANVFLRIIPRLVKGVAAAKRGEPVNQEWAINAKNRSTHNTYLTLPVIFIMISNHFPNTYGHKLNWLILLLISAAGACIREFFVVRLKNPLRSKCFLAVGITLILGVMLFSKENIKSISDPNPVKKSSAIEGPLIKSGVKGVVQFQGILPKREKLMLPLACAQNAQTEVYANDILINDNKIKNVLLRITKGLEGKTFDQIPEKPVQLDQRYCQYEPRIIGVRVGQRIEFINSDPVFHNVKSLSKNNAEFNVAMPNQNDRIAQVFDKPEILLQTKCSVHPWMSAWIAVVEHPFFSVSNSQGEYEIPGLSPGHYTLEAWHEVFGTLTREIEVRENEVLSVEFIYQK